jgi:hypothetical protein
MINYIPSIEDLASAYSVQEDYLGAYGDAEKAIQYIKAEAIREFLEYFDPSEMHPERTDRYIKEVEEGTK